MEECVQEDWSVSDVLGTTAPWSGTYHPVVGGSISLNLGTKASFHST